MIENEKDDPNGIQTDTQAPSTSDAKGLKRKSFTSRPDTKKLRGTPKLSIKTGATKRHSLK